MIYHQGQHITGSNIPPGGYCEPDEVEYELSDAPGIFDLIRVKVANYFIENGLNGEQVTRRMDILKKQAQAQTHEFFLSLDNLIFDGAIDEWDDVIEPILSAHSMQ